MTSGPRAEPLSIAALTADQLDAAAALIASELPSASPSATPAHLQKALASEETVALAATRQAILLGVLIAHRAVDRLEVHALAVAAATRRRGIATVLLERALTDACRAGLVGADLEVGADNLDAQGFYRSRAFVAVGRRPRYYRGVEDALLMSREFDARGR